MKGLVPVLWVNLLPLALLSAGEPSVAVEVEEVVYTYTSANNGASPMWCAGSSCLLRHEDRVFATGLETLSDASPLNNCRWVLFERTETGWVRVHEDEGRTREPAPLVGFHDGRVFVSGNPSLGKGPEPGGGPAEPEILVFDPDKAQTPIQRLVPKWEGQPRFREHSYRSFAADGAGGEFVLFQNIDYGHAEWTFQDRQGNWSRAGKIHWPVGGEYDPPRPLRLCYPNVALRDRAVHFFGVGDIVEPNEAWSKYKYQLTERKWDYVFRRLFYSYTPDIPEKPFGEWIEIASREETAGALWPCDLWLGENDLVHLLWTDRALDERLKETFFPEAEQSHSLNYAVLRGGERVRQTVLLQSTEKNPGLVAGRARFHVTPSGGLYVVAFVSGRDGEGNAVQENRLLELDREGKVKAQVRVPLERPFTNFFTTTPRSGSRPSELLELLGTQMGRQEPTIAYARIKLGE